MPKRVCPACQTEMKMNKHGLYVCPSCNGVFLEEKPRKSIFGVT